MKKEAQYDVICIGQILQDILVTDIPENALISGKDTYMAGMVQMSLGGDAANEAATLAKLGDHTAILARLGRDTTGETLLSALNNVNVDTSLLCRMDECKNFSSIVVIKTNKEHTYFVGPGKNYLLTKADINYSIFEKTRVVSAGSLFALGELDVDGIDIIFEKARQSNAVTVADMTYDFQKLGSKVMEKVYPHVDYLMPSFEEGNYVTGKTSPEQMAQYFLDAGVKNVVIKLGKEGCYFKNRKKAFYTDPFLVNPLNTTGCGDNFVAGFIHCLLQGRTEEECAEFACGIGALNSLGVGASLFVQSEEHVKKFMAETERKRVIRK